MNVKVLHYSLSSLTVLGQVKDLTTLFIDTPLFRNQQPQWQEQFLERVSKLTPETMRLRNLVVEDFNYNKKKYKKVKTEFEILKAYFTDLKKPRNIAKEFKVSVQHVY